MGLMRLTPAGWFRDQIQILARKTSVTNELGEVVPSDIPIAIVFAYVKPLRSMEMMENAENDLVVTHEIRISWRPDVTHSCALLYRGRRLNVVDVTDVLGHRRELAITAKEERP